MWNVSESTVKRWADSSGLKCGRTPGGHRRFLLEDIHEFQQKRAFEATGILSTEEWEDPELEFWVNSRRFSKVCELLLYLCRENQRTKVSCLLERLYLRGMQLDEIYDTVVTRVNENLARAKSNGEFSEGQNRLVRILLDQALGDVASRMICKRKNGKTALSASPSRFASISVNVASKLLEIEGWETMNLGEDVSFEIMSEVVETEPVNLVSIVTTAQCRLQTGEFEKLHQVTEDYRIPLLLTHVAESSEIAQSEALTDKLFLDFSSFRAYLSRISH